MIYVSALNENPNGSSKNLMDKLSNELLHGTPGLIQQLQNNIVHYNIHEQFGVVLRWIDYLVKNNRVNEAILWCDLIPKDSGELYLAHQTLALQLLTDNPDIQTILLYQNETQFELSCQEAIFLVLPIILPNLTKVVVMRLQW